MLRKLAKRLTNNFGLKILAAVFAAVLWLIVVNVEDPDRATMITIPVTIENEAYLTELGKTYDIQKNAEVSFTVSARRSIIEELSESDFTAVANMENINEEMTQVPIAITSSRYTNQIEITRRTSAAYLQVHVENLVTAKYDIEPELEGEPAENCYIDGTEVSPRRVTVTGPESVVDTIRSARVTVSVDRAEENVAANGEVVLLDGDGNQVSQDRLSLNRTKAAVDVSVMMRKEVPLKIETRGKLPKEYLLGTVSGSLEKVKLTGPPEVLDQLNALEISAPQLDISERTGDFTVTLGLANFLPEDVALEEGEPATVDVTVQIIGQEVRRFEVPSENITVKHLPRDLSLEFNSDTVTVMIRGFAEDLDQIRETELKGTLDASGLDAGRHSVQVTLEGDHDLAADVRAGVTVSEKERETGDGNQVSED